MSELLNVAQVAAILQVSPDTAVRLFSGLPGVMNLGTNGSLKKRRYRVLRIPRHVVEKFVGHPVTVPAVAPRTRQRKDWMREAALSLAKAIVDNAADPMEREVFKKIAYDARTLVFVPEEEWDSMTMLEAVD